MQNGQPWGYFSLSLPMPFAYLFFWISLLLLFYTYAGYGILLYIINLGRSKQHVVHTPSLELPSITLIVPAYNEAEWLSHKVQNSLELDYPAGKLEIIFVTDGSTDESNWILQQHSSIRALFQPGRKGKMAAINRAMQYVTTPIVVFSDVNTILNKDCLLHIANHYADDKVGGVAGEKKIYTKSFPLGMGYSEGLYWKYESMLKQLDSDFNTVVGAAGELFSMRTSLFTAQNENIILDDFLLSMTLCVAGYKVVYEPKAYAIEAPSINIKEERKRRVRIAAGAFQTIPLLWKHLLIINKPVLYFQYFSRRLLRWVACPLCLVALYVCNAAILVNEPGALVFYLFFIVQNIFYIVAVAGALWYKAGARLNILTIPFYFVFMNVLLVQGFLRHIAGKQSVIWEKSKRTVIPLQVKSP